jgi:hypothetical protein
MSATALPRLTKVAEALRTTTERLALELAFPGIRPPVWTDFEWQIAQAAAAMNGVSSLLYSRLRWKGPVDWERFLSEQHIHSVARDVEIVRLLDEIDSQARDAGLGLVALKGAALHADKIYSAGERPMGDIDLLIDRKDAEALARVLESCGYVTAFTTHRHEVFQSRIKKVVTRHRLGEHVDNPIKIEVHTQIAERLPFDAIDITEFLIPGSPHAGLNQYPSNTSLMMHLLLHAAGNMRARALRLIQLHDIALIATRFTSNDWRELLALRTQEGSLWWGLPPLVLTARYFPVEIPADLLVPLNSECPWLLRMVARRQRVTDVSWSNIRIAAFPGLEWSRSVGEAIKFMRSRVWPSRQSLSELREGAAQIPESPTVSWYGVSHATRILRWTFSRPPRVQTLLSVRAAMKPREATSFGENEWTNPR